MGTAAADRHIAGMKSPDSAADEENPPRLAPHAWARSLTDSGDAMFIATADEARGAELDRQPHGFTTGTLVSGS